MENQNMQRIQRVSERFQRLFTVLTAAIPLLTLLYWVFFNYLPLGLITQLPVPIQSSLVLEVRLLAFLISLIPVSVAIYGLVNLKRLFRLYEQAIVFSQQNVLYFRRIGYTLMYWVLANQIFVALISVVLTINNPPGERMLVAQLGISDIGSLIIGGVVVLVSWVMNEASKMEREQAYTV